MASLQELILKRLRAEGDDLIAAFGALAPDDWALTIYTYGAAWTPREILAHQVSTERAILALVKDLLAGGAGMPEGFEIQAFNEAWAARLAPQPAESLYAEFRAARAATIAVVETMAPEDFARRGRHPWYGEASLEDTLKVLYRHNMLHMRDIQRAVRARDAGGPLRPERL